MESERTVYWIWLEMIFGVSNVKLLEMVRHAGSVRDLYYTLHDSDCGLLNERERGRLRQTDLHQAKEVLERCEKTGIGVMTWDDELYPESLRNIYNPPCVLFYRGDPTLLHREMLLTVVGTRHPSQYSKKVADWLCTDLARCSVILVSGCAVGLDAAAHSAAISVGMPTIGVMGCGVDYDYPAENRALKERIVRNGLLLSEYFPGTPPRGYYFPVRNRILAGVSEAVLVLEAGARSGSLITANLACEQGKSVFCVPPGDLFDKRYSGVVGFLRDGAYPVFNHLDVLYAFYLKYPYRLSLYDESESSRTQDSLLFDEPRKAPPRRTVPRKSAAPAEKSAAPSGMPEDATDEQRRILESLRGGGQSIDSLCLTLGLGFEQISMLLMEMEMNGWVINTERSIYALPE